MENKKFIKRDTAARLIRFEVEERGLAAIRATGAIKVPDVYEVGIDSGSSFISMEYVEAGPRISDYFETFGRELAFMHRADTSGLTKLKYGFFEDGFIGEGEQPNTPAESFVGFFRDFRLRPMYDKAKVYMGAGDRKAMERILDHLDDYLAEPAFPSLLHGDLWGGNFVTGPDGRAWLIDPAAYVGHFEAELAMTELFGANPPAFYAAYAEVTPIEPEYRDRRDLYNLYHILNHLNIFGASYLSSALSVIRRYGG